MKSGIYFIKCLVNNKYYIGSSKNILQRFNKHRSLLKRNKHHSIHLQRAWNKHGEINFEFGIIENVPYNDKILELETSYIKKYKSNKGKYGFNILEFAGTKLGSKHTKKTIELIIKNNHSKNKFYENAVRPARKTYQYDIDGNFIKEWLCVKRASDELKIGYKNIFKCMNKEREICHGFRWLDKYEGDKIESISKAVIQRDLNDKFIAEFELIKDIIEKYPTFNAPNIWAVCNGLRKQVFGYKWIYKKDIKNE